MWILTLYFLNKKTGAKLVVLVNLSVSGQPFAHLTDKSYNRYM